MRALPSGDEVSIATFSFESLLLTGSRKSIAQLVLNCRPLSRLSNARTALLIV